jgi:predicted DNA-binding protein
MPDAVLVRLPADVYKQLKAASEANERTCAQTARLAIKQYLVAVGSPETTT